LLGDECIKIYESYIYENILTISIYNTLTPSIFIDKELLKEEQMELLQLTYFCDAAITQNFSKTAEKYQVPPSNISQSIKRLENELSVALFDRNANRVVLNKQRHIFYEKAHQALELLEDAKLSVAGAEQSS
jgi:predicted DNA-binding protein YlxM (UPF0122 family)